jgi:hypothetical protein
VGTLALIPHESEQVAARAPALHDTEPHERPHAYEDCREPKRWDERAVRMREQMRKHGYVVCLD